MGGVGREVGSKVLKCFVRGGQNFYYAPEETSGGILKSLCPSIRPSVRPSVTIPVSAISHKLLKQIS